MNIPPTTLTEKILEAILLDDVMRPALTNGDPVANARHWHFLQHGLQTLEATGWLTDPDDPGGVVGMAGAAPGSYDDEADQRQLEHDEALAALRRVGDLMEDTGRHSIGFNTYGAQDTHFISVAHLRDALHFVAVDALHRALHGQEASRG